MVNALTGCGPNGSIAGPPFSPKDISGCVAFWDFNNSSSLTTSAGHIINVADGSGSGNDMAQGGSALTGPVQTSGGYNSRLYGAFNGTTQYLNAAAFTYTSGNQMSMVARVNGAAQSKRIILGYYDPGAGDNFFWASGETHTDRLLGFVNEPFGASASLESTQTAFDSTWHTVILTYDGPTGTLNLYVDNANSNVGSGPTTWVGTNPLEMGGLNSSSAGTRFFAGGIEYMAMYTSILSPTDRTNLQNYGA